MKNIKQVLAILLTLICVFNFKPCIAHADDDGYYIKNMDVQVKINDKREYKVTETLNVYFNEERHGIIRKIPKSTQLEDYNITNVNVDGAPFEEDGDTDLELKIGDEDETIEGDKKYVITYTLQCYDDEQVDGDYIYLNVLGTQWDTYIENFTSTITYPNNAKVEYLNITDGEYGSTTSTYIKYNNEGNKINISSKSKIPSNCGITVNAKLNEGTFKNAPIRKYPYIIKSDILNAEITKQKEYLITRQYIVDTNENRDKNDLSYIYLWESDSYDYIKDVSIDNNVIYFDSSDNTLVLPKEKGTYKFKVSYKIEPTLFGTINFLLNNPNNLGKTESLQVNITSPYDIDRYNVDFKEKGVNLGTKRYEVNNDKKTLTFTNLNNINLGEKININIDIDNSLFTRPTPFIHYISNVGSILVLLVLIFLYFKNKDKNPPISSVEFYPPNDLNSAEVAYAYKQSISNKDVISLLFYWASHNHIKITLNKDNSFKLTKIKDLDNKHKSYEKSIFREIFKAGKNNTVTDTQLKDAEIKSILDAKEDIKSYFNNEKSLKDKSSYKKARLIGLLPVISIILAYIYDSIISHETILFSLFLSLFPIASLLISTNIYINVNKNRYTHNGKKKSIIYGIILSLVYLFIEFVFLIFTNIPEYTILLTLAISVAGIILSGLVPTRSQYGKDILGKINGFRNFIEVAEKERLEALLEEDPYYFYNTLPYAQVLGVTKKWTDKFEGLTMKEPDYYDTYYPMSNVYAMSMLCHSLDNVSSSVNYSVYSPPSDSSGGFGGGGFSGGGSGGGGGSSW